MNEKDILKRVRMINKILILVIIILLALVLFAYKKYFDEKRDREIGNIINNAFSETETNVEKAEKALSVMDRMTFSDSGGMVLFISIYYWPDEELKLEELADAIEEVKKENWFNYDYAVIEIWNPQIGMVTSIETNLETMETRSYGWYDEEIGE